MLALLMDLVSDEVRALFGRANVVFLEKINVGFWSRALVLWIVHEADLVEFASHCSVLRSSVYDLNE